MNRRKLRARKRRYAKRSTIEVLHQRISAATFATLDADERYCISLSGHIYNELSFLYRLACISANQPVFNELSQHGAFMQALFFARLLLAKLYEAQIVFQKNPLKSFFEGMTDTQFNPSISAAFDQLVKEMQSFEWLGRVRNQHASHYPGPSKLNPALDSPNIEWDLDIIHGWRSLNSLYVSSDVAANIAWFETIGEKDWKQSLGVALKATTQLTMKILRLLEEANTSFVEARLAKISDASRTRVPAMRMEDVRLPFFFDLRPGRRKR